MFRKSRYFRFCVGIRKHTEAHKHATMRWLKYYQPLQEKKGSREAAETT